MEEAILTEDGKLLCKCGEPLGFTKDHDLVVVNGETYIQFVKYCSSKKCSCISHYEVIITIDDRKVFVFNKKDIKKVTSEDNKTKTKEIEE